MRKQILKIVTKIRRLYWRVFQPITLGVKILIVVKEEVLLIRNTYHSSWFLPGGGVDKGESVQEAARREILEECGISLQDKIEVQDIYYNNAESKNDHIVFFVKELKIKPNVNKQNSEISECAFFPRDDLPNNISPATERRINDFFHNNPTQRTW